MRSPAALARTLGVPAAFYCGCQAWRLWQAYQRAARLSPPTIPASGPTASRRVLLVGDSIGVGLGVPRGSETLHGLLASRFQRAAIDNRCRTGARVGELGAQIAARTHDRVELALVCAGGNDAVWHTPLALLRDEVRRTLETLRGCAAHTVWIGTANLGASSVLSPPFDWLASRLTRRTMASLALVVRRHGATFIGFHDSAHDRLFARDAAHWFAADGFHPGAHSHRYCFERLRATLPLDEWLGAGVD